MSKFKEYWLFKGDETEFIVYEERLSGPESLITHVIEYAAYESVLAELAGLKNSLEVADIAEEAMIADMASKYVDDDNDGNNKE